ncbi:MAG: DUF2155 domain-containing protein [Fuscovulum sp.]|nr:DUF2155 domain-containing protein [Fuscovulum sp.]
MRALAAALCLAALPAGAQEFAEAPGGVLRWLDKLTGQTGDMELARGQSASNGRLTIQMDACLYPADNPAADAQAHLTVVDTSREGPVFSGWMLASSPALSALDHPRYDVWVLRCVVPGYTPPEAAETTDEAEGE